VERVAGRADDEASCRLKIRAHGDREDRQPGRRRRALCARFARCRSRYRTDNERRDGARLARTGPAVLCSRPNPDREVRMFFELRQYHIRPGQQANWVKCMEEEIIPFQVKMGMVILGSFVGEDDDSTYVWIRRFESEQERKRLYDLVYQSDYWKNEISPRVPSMIDREQIKVTRLVATPHSVIQ
jgi:hypothetical protein